DAGGGVATRLPPPTILPISAVMYRSNLAQLQCIDDQTHVTMRGEPHSMMLKGRLVAIASAAGMAADVQNRREFRAGLGVPGQVHIAGNVKSRPALEVEIFDSKSLLPLQ